MEASARTPERTGMKCGSGVRGEPPAPCADGCLGQGATGGRALRPGGSQVDSGAAGPASEESAVSKYDLPIDPFAIAGAQCCNGICDVFRLADAAIGRHLRGLGTKRGRNVQQ